MSSTEGNKTTIASERIEQLRGIMQREQHRRITYDEAFEVAHLLLRFYDNLADNNVGAGKSLLAES